MADCITLSSDDEVEALVHFREGKVQKESSSKKMETIVKIAVQRRPVEGSPGTSKKGLLEGYTTGKKLTPAVDLIKVESPKTIIPRLPDRKPIEVIEIDDGDDDKASMRRRGSMSSSTPSRGANFEIKRETDSAKKRLIHPSPIQTKTSSPTTGGVARKSTTGCEKFREVSRLPKGPTTTPVSQKGSLHPIKKVSIRTVSTNQEKSQIKKEDSKKEKEKPVEPPAPVKAPARNLRGAKSMEVNYLFQKIVDLCGEKDSSKPMEVGLMKLSRYFGACSKDYLKSSELKSLLIKELETAQGEGNWDPFEVVHRVLEELKKNPHVKSSKLRKLELTLQKVNRRIKTLEAMEIDSSDEEQENAYILLDKYRKRALEIYYKMCEIRDVPKDAERQYLRRVSFSGSGAFPAVEAALEKYYNTNRKFPNYPQVRRLVKQLAKKEGKTLTEYDINDIAKKYFVDFGTVLQRRRLYDDYSMAMEYLEEKGDPAEYDTDLRTKLEMNRKVRQKGKTIDDIIDEYARRQELKTKENPPSGSETNGSESESNSEEDSSKESEKKCRFSDSEEEDEDDQDKFPLRENKPTSDKEEEEESDDDKPEAKKRRLSGDSSPESDEKTEPEASTSELNEEKAKWDKLIFSDDEDDAEAKSSKEKDPLNTSSSLQSSAININLESEEEDDDDLDQFEANQTLVIGGREAQVVDVIETINIDD